MRRHRAYLLTRVIGRSAAWTARIDITGYGPGYGSQTLGGANDNSSWGVDAVG